MGHKFRVEPYAFVAAAAMILVLPLNWIITAFFAACFHEFCHYFVIRLFGQPVRRITIGSSRAAIAVHGLSRGMELICAAAGPIGSLSLMLLVRWVPRLAVCGLVQGIFNLIPVYPMDGGRILRCIASEKVCRFVHRGTIAVFILFGLAMIKYSLIPLIAAGVWSIRLMERKIPCKDAGLRVQ